MNLITLFFGHRGRLNRSKYWLTAVVYLAVWVVPLALTVHLIGPTEGDPFEEEVVRQLESASGATFTGLVASVALLIAVWLVTVISSVLVAIRRLHDRNKSGWWVLFLYFLPGVCIAVADELGKPSVVFLAFLLYLAAFAVSIWALVELGFQRGTDGPNRFGPDPRRRNSASRAALL
jgi:uncharacterized membrane protein YhaH (DUF805 family)